MNLGFRTESSYYYCPLHMFCTFILVTAIVDPIAADSSLICRDQRILCWVEMDNVELGPRDPAYVR